MTIKSKYFAIAGKIDCLFYGKITNRNDNTSYYTFVSLDLKNGMQYEKDFHQTDLYCLLVR